MPRRRIGGASPRPDAGSGESVGGGARHDGGMSQAMTLNPEQHEFRAVLRQFCEDKIAPGAARRDELGEYDWDAFKAIVAMDLPALGMPAEYGGTGADLVTQAIAAEE